MCNHVNGFQYTLLFLVVSTEYFRYSYTEYSQAFNVDLIDVTHVKSQSLSQTSHCCTGKTYCHFYLYTEVYLKSNLTSSFGDLYFNKIVFDFDGMSHSFLSFAPWGNCLFFSRKIIFGTPRQTCHSKMCFHSNSVWGSFRQITQTAI